MERGREEGGENLGRSGETIERRKTEEGTRKEVLMVDLEM